MIREPGDLPLLSHQPSGGMTEGRREYMPVCLMPRSFLMNQAVASCPDTVFCSVIPDRYMDNAFVLLTALIR
ncbi:hypothetical protein [Komagataeibacter rhaeticus]|jgi:hypothetical protein|uniref:hypothetical protein n=1 Tax=Komagataeibacter rhaeticus TaxID=215221 RepID=UPI0012EB56B5|nr:hypothetical protein [Komagataeibacter rhaeticus]